MKAHQKHLLVKLIIAKVAGENAKHNLFGQHNIVLTIESDDFPRKLMLSLYHI